MSQQIVTAGRIWAPVCVWSILLWMSPAAEAHCDTMDGPVVTDARAALDTGDVTPVLKWVPLVAEAEVNQAFERALVVRAKGPEARELADLYFFETLVRLHRAGEGEPYTGLKPAGTLVGSAEAAADQALAQGSVEELARKIAAKVEAGIQQRFAEAIEAASHKDHSVTAGRAFVARYVQFVHYVEHVHQAAAAGHSGKHDHAAQPPLHVPADAAAPSKHAGDPRD